MNDQILVYSNCQNVSYYMRVNADYQFVHNITDNQH